MKSFKSLSILAVFIISAFVLTSSKCGSTCVAPSIVFDPSGTTMTKAPGEVLTFNIVVTGDADNIASIVVSKSSNGVTNPTFMSVTSIGSKGKTVTLTDSVPASVTYGSVITYTVTATSDCKDASADTKTMTVTVGPSSVVLDPLIYEVKNSQAPRIYSRFSSLSTNPSAWNLQNRIGEFAANPNADKDVRDSSTGISGTTPFTGFTRFGSRNGSKFVNAGASFDYTNASAKSIVDAYNAGTKVDLVTYNANDNIIVNIKNGNTYAVINILSIVDDGAASGEDYTFIKYKLAQ